MDLIYFIGWLITIFIGFIWIDKNKNPVNDYSLAGFFVCVIALIWPISFPFLLIDIFDK